MPKANSVKVVRCHMSCSAQNRSLNNSHSFCWCRRPPDYPICCIYGPKLSGCSRPRQNKTQDRANIHPTIIYRIVNAEETNSPLRPIPQQGTQARTLLLKGDQAGSALSLTLKGDQSGTALSLTLKEDQVGHTAA